MIWLVAAAMAAIVAGAVLRPLWQRGASGAGPDAAYDLRVYRQQLAEVDRDVARGTLGAVDADRLRTEIGRKILDADRLAQAAAAPRRGGIWPAAALMTALLAGSLALYGRLGAPQMPDQPRSLRLAAAEAAYRSRPTQAQAEAAYTPPPVQADADYLALIAQVRDTVAKRPQDPQGLALLALHESRLGRPAAARDAMARLIAVKGANATAGDHAQLAALMADAAGGILTPEAEAQMRRALSMDPADPQARFLQGVLDIQNGRPDRAFPVWRDLLADPPAGNPPWLAAVRANITDLAWFAGDTRYRPPPLPAPSDTVPDALPGPDAAAVADAAALTPDQRAQMVRDMVSRLEGRLATEGGTPQEWARLIASHVALGKREHAAAILAEARMRFAAAPPALAIVNAAAKQAGLP